MTRRSSRRTETIAVLGLLLVGILGLVGCAGGAGDGAVGSIDGAAGSSDGGAGSADGDANGTVGDSASLSERDARALSGLAVVAARDAEVTGVPTGVDCWAPSEHFLPVGAGAGAGAGAGVGVGAGSEAGVGGVAEAEGNAETETGADTDTYIGTESEADAKVGVESDAHAGARLDPRSEAFRVICRVHYEQQGASRYRDMICIGDLGREPVAESCYQWAFYSDMPKFEDHLAYRATASK